MYFSKSLTEVWKGDCVYVYVYFGLLQIYFGTHTTYMYIIIIIIMSINML